jgi:hypothetical protein
MVVFQLSAFGLQLSDCLSAFFFRLCAVLQLSAFSFQLSDSFFQKHGLLALLRDFSFSRSAFSFSAFSLQFGFRLSVQPSAFILQLSV